MSRRHNVELAGISTPYDERQSLVREIEALEREDDEAHRLARAHRRAAGHESTDDGGSQGRKRPLSIESALADPMLSTVQRELAREERAEKIHKRYERDRSRLAELITVTEDRAHWAAELIYRQESEAWSTIELLFASHVVETERRERARRFQGKLQEQVQEYMERQELIDNLHGAMVEDRWLTRDKVLREAEENRAAQRQVEDEWRQRREHGFLDEVDIFASMSG